MKKKLMIWLSILVLILFLIGVYFTWFFAYTCKDIKCFREHQIKCSKAKFINEDKDSVWLYSIKGKENARCKIKVSLLDLKEGKSDKEKLIGKSMVCYLMLENINPPEKDLSICNGLLKEELQDLIIQKLHKYLVDNLGDINEVLN